MQHKHVQKMSTSEQETTLKVFLFMDTLNDIKNTGALLHLSLSKLKQTTVNTVMVLHSNTMGFLYTVIMY